MHHQSKHAGASLDPMVKQHLVRQVGGVAQCPQRDAPLEFDDIDQELVDTAIDSPRGISVETVRLSAVPARLDELERSTSRDSYTGNAHVARLQLHLRPIGLRAANAFVAARHRHHGPTRGHKFSVSVADAQGQIRGVAIAGRPVARRLDDGAHLEVLRVCTDGTPNACSMLYGAVRRAAKAMGYRSEHIITYTLEGEDGASLRAAGWQLDGRTDGGSWDRPSRSRVDSHPTERKLRWHAT